MAAGFVNAHTHVYSGLAPLGLPPPRREPANFLEILREIWWRLDRAIDERTLTAAARLYIAEALLHGSAVIVDHHESPSFIDGSLDVIADACQTLGIRAVLCYGATERNGGREEAARGLAECRRFIASNRRPLVCGVVGLHASFTVSDETIREAGDLCREVNTVMHVHVAEDRADVDDARRRGYDGPLQRLEALNALPPGSILAHGVHLNAEEVRRASALGCWIVQNPRSNRNNKVGYPPALGESTRVALGTDGFVSDMAEETAALVAEAAAHGEDLSVVSRRPGAGNALAAERFGSDALSPPPADLEALRGELEGIRANAREAAAMLWRRM